MPLQFAHPAIFAAGLACIAMPILVHLLTRRRRRTVRWGAMRFLLEAYRKQKRRLQLEQLILLLLRCALIALIGFAIARPLLGDAGSLGGARTLVIVLDDSLTAGVTDTEGRSAFERTRSRAIELIDALDTARGDAVGLVTLAGPARALVLPPSSDLAGVTRVIEQLERSQSSADWAGLSTELDSWLVENELGTPDVVVLSDLLQGSAPMERALKPLMKPVRFLVETPRETGPTNVAIAEVQPPRSLLVVSALSPADLASPVRVKLTRSGPGVSEGAVSTVVAWLDPVGAQDRSREIGRTTVRWAPGESEAEAAMTVRPTALDGTGSMGVLRVEIDRDALPDDNMARAPIELRQKLRVGIVAPARFGREVGVGQFESADWVRLALAPSDDDAGGMDLVALPPGSLDRPRLAGLDAVIVLRPDLVSEPAWDLLAQVARVGGIVIIAPPADAVLHTWGDSVSRAFEIPWSIAREQAPLDAETALAEPAMSDAGSVLRVLAGELSFLVRSVHVLQILPIQAPEQDVLLRTGSGQPFLVMSRPAESRGAVALLASGIDPKWTDLPTKPMMVPLFQELVRQGVARGARGTTMLAGGVPTVDAQVTELEPLDAGAPIRITDAERPAIRTAGVWRARDAEGVARGLLVSNADPTASRTGAQPLPQLEQWLSPLAGGQVTFIDSALLPSAAANRAAAGADDRAGFGWIIFVVAFLLGITEMYLARWASHAEVSSPVGGGA